ncbi:transporter [Streptococcus sp. ZJ93]|uniref:transporter n=1 Tax=Streptococcus handemini TaxID=3161188 RepID=UPI0032EE1E97
MTLFWKNRLFRTLALSRLLNTFGAYIYNIVFVLYAANKFQSSWAVAAANIIMVLPTVFTLFVGIKADQTKKKARMMVVATFIQAILFTIMAFLLQNATIVIFSIVCLINVVSDILSDYSAGLRLPILQKNIASDNLMEAYSFLQLISYICNLLGQAVGIWLLDVTGNNYTLVALINAGTFFLSGMLLLLRRKELTHAPIEVQEDISFSEQFRDIVASMKLIFEDGESGSFLSVLTAVLAINALGGGLAAIYNIYFLKDSLFALPYGQAIFLVNLILAVGLIAGSLTPNDYFAKLPISKIMVLTSISFAVMALLNVAGVPAIAGITVLAFAAYLSGKVNPKIDSLLLANTSPEMLARTNNLLSLLFTLSLPVGTIVFSSLASFNIFLCWLVFLSVSVLSLYLSMRTRKNTVSIVES